MSDDGMAKGNACVIGDVEIFEDGNTESLEMVLVIQFQDVRSIKKAIDSGKCEFTVLGS